jgi:tetratricopeptide (TPR) repeat protein
MLRLFSLLAMPAIAILLSATAAMADDRNTCLLGGAGDKRAIAACGRVLQAGNLSQKLRIEVLTKRGVLLGLERQFAKAEADFKEAIRIDPRKAQAWIERATMYRESGDLDRAIASITEYIRLHSNAEASALRAYLHQVNGDLGAAINDITAAINMGAKTDAHLASRAEWFLKQGEFNRAIADYNELVKMLPDDISSYIGRAGAYEKKGDLQLALRDYRKAMSMDRQYSVEQGIDRKIAKAEQALAAKATDGQSASASAREQTPAPVVRPQQEASQVAPPPPKPVVTSPPERRVALVIGNSAYAHAARLPNPQADADALAHALARAGFASVELGLDLKREQLLDTLKSFARTAAGADWAVIYFAGHGLEIGGVNYLVPVDAKLASDRDVTFEAVALEQVLHSVDGAKKLRIAILDACRDNPFVKSMSRSIATRSLGRGLAAVEPQRATLVAYAARHGQVALDGAGANSPYVSALIRQLETPGVEISLLFRKVRDDVMASTRNAQEPFTYGSLPSEAFYFRNP